MGGSSLAREYNANRSNASQKEEEVGNGPDSRAPNFFSRRRRNRIGHGTRAEISRAGKRLAGEDPPALGLCRGAKHSLFHIADLAVSTRYDHGVLPTLPIRPHFPIDPVSYGVHWAGYCSALVLDMARLALGRHIYSRPNGQYPTHSPVPAGSRMTLSIETDTIG